MHRASEWHLFEDVQYTDKGKIRNNSFMQYKISDQTWIFGKYPRWILRAVMRRVVRFGAKSIGELVIDTPCPAIARGNL